MVAKSSHEVDLLLLIAVIFEPVAVYPRSLCSLEQEKVVATLELGQEKRVAPQPQRSLEWCNYRP